MGQPFIGECKIVAFNYAPAGWAMCAGQILPISENDALFTLIGTTYGGDGQSTFGLPDLQGRVPIHQGAGPGQNFDIGSKAGTENVVLVTAQLPVHNHALMASGSSGNGNLVQGSALAGNATAVYRNNTNPPVPMNANAITNQGGSQPHPNIQPYLTMTWVISLYGLYPSAS